ncbi:MAG: CheR family methyltransferase [bacterium]|nr:CheR family methyltransferase [bacterium]
MIKKKTKSKIQALKATNKLGRTPRAIVGIGASAGGLEAVTELLQNLPEKTGMAFVYVQHLDPTHKSLLAPILARVAHIPILEVKQGTRVEADHFYVIPPNKNMFIESGVLRLVTRVRGEERLVTIDNFFRSLASDQKSSSIGVILSGNASDGVLGLEAIKSEGGITFAQNEESAKHGSMPHSAIESGTVDHTLVPKDIARELGRISRHPYVTPMQGIGQDPSVPFGDKEQGSLQKIFAMLQTKSGVNFFHYKSPTLRRRIGRRMVLCRIGTLPQYITYLQKTPAEVEALFQDMLIHVTEFFRDPETFDYLKKRVFPLIVKEHKKDEPIRIWSAGCSTGEEAYSLAISFVEYLENSKRKVPLQIFGSDLNEASIVKARAGIYPSSIGTNVSPERLRRFFKKVGGQYQISKAIRDMCIFAKQDLISDPSFSQLDLITCRNVLIYLEPAAQKRILPMFHYALKESGVLMLGKSEGVGEYTDLFQTKHETHKIFAKKMSSRRPHFRTLQSEGTATDLYNLHKDLRAKGLSVPPVPLTQEGELSKDVDRILLSSGFVPASIVIDEEMQIVQFRGHLLPYLNFPTGKVTWSLLKMAHQDLVLELRGAVNDAKKKQKRILRNNIELFHNGEACTVNIEVIPLKYHNPAERHLLIVLRPGETPMLKEMDTSKGTSGGEKKKHTVLQIEKLEQELGVAKERLRTALEEEEGAREEFQAVNEEVVSSNEELQSTNEELETAKEELQSTNEELITVNEELQTRNAELGQTNNDLTNVLSSAHVPIIIVDRELRIRRFTPMAEKSLRIIPSDIGRSITDIKLPIRFPDLRKLLLRVIESVEPEHQEVEDEEGRWHTLWVRPYKTWDNKIDGAVITLIDINEIKKAQAKLEQTLSYAQGILGTMREPLLVLDKNLKVMSANPAFYTTFSIAEKDTVGVLIYELTNRRWDTPKLREALEKILPQKSSFNDLEITFDFPNIGSKVMLFNGRRLVQSGKGEELILLAMQDITEQAKVAELGIANKELAFQNKEKEKRAAELIIANKELVFQNGEKEKRAAELIIANKELIFQNSEKAKRAAELIIANKELAFQNKEKAKRAAELIIANKELAFQAKLEQTLSYAQGILGTMREPLLVLDKNLRIKTANGAFYTMFSVTAKDTDGVLIYELKNRRWDTPQLREVLEKILPKKSSFSDLEITFDFPGLGSKVMLFNGRRLVQSGKGEELILLAMQDITEQRLLQQRNDSFMSMASHELKTPVTTIKTLVQILEKRYEKSEDKVLVEYLPRIDQQIEQLTKLVIDLLDVSKIKADKLQLEEKIFDFDELAMEMIKSCQLLSPQHTIVVNGKTKAKVKGDRNSISRVFINLIVNAIKYSPKANKIIITLSHTKKDVSVSVEDFGIGIAKAHQNKIFERFFQVGNESGQIFSGLGIGLYISQAIVVQHKGRIWVESKGSKGSTFFFTLPIQKSK